MTSSSEKGTSVVSDINKLEADLSFKLDGNQIKEIESFEFEIFPSARSGMIELIEDKSDDIQFGSSIHCQSLQWEFKFPLKWS